MKDTFVINGIRPFEPVGWLEVGLPKSVIGRLQSYIETAKKDPILNNSMLAGNITKSLVLKDKDDWFFQNILSILIGKFRVADLFVCICIKFDDFLEKCGVRDPKAHHGFGCKM